ncbi:5'/3'-nucleotidase sure [Panus rudis PR-1116 ss-1]|nr:5'/3'-nucleotidase sure [Panus rudis PR-1116 ss-1]
MSTSALNILLTNDDSWASANIRATYDALKSDGHNVLLVGPAVQQSSTGGTFKLPATNITAPGGEFGTIPVGAPYFGAAVDDPHIWYFNGTPVATALFALDIIVPKVWPHKKIDLVVSGPNEGSNTGPFTFTLSGTIGATYALTERNLPAVAFSAGNGTHRPFTDNTGKPDDPANIVGKLTANFVTALARKVRPGHRILPLGVGISVNYPTFGPGNGCTKPPFEFTRVTRGATVDKIAIDPATGFPIRAPDIATDGINVLINGRKDLPGETPLSAKCKTAVSIFSIDYDAPRDQAGPIQEQLRSIIGKTHI